MFVTIRDLICEIDMLMQLEDFKKYLNMETGVIITVGTEELSIAEELEDEDDFLQYPDWQTESLQDARDIIINRDKYVELPDMKQINEYNIMKSFCASLENGSKYEFLFSAFREKAVCQPIKEVLKKCGIEQEWYSYYEEALRAIAIKWCEDCNVNYTE